MRFHLEWLAAALLALAQGSEPIPPTPFDEVFELELTDTSPWATAEYFVDFEGTLHVWTRSELGLSVRVEDVDTGEIVGTGEDPGARLTPYVKLQVELNDELAITVSSADDAARGRLELHVVAAPETDVTRAAASAARERMAEALRWNEQDDPNAARAVVDEALDRLLGARGRHSEAIAAAAWDLGSVADRVDQLAAARSAWEAALEHCERTRPGDHPDLHYLRANLALVIRDMGELATARALQEGVVAAYERGLRADHPQLLVARTNLALMLRDMGELAAARALQEAVLAAYERTLPADHPVLLGARHNLAVTLRRTGDPAAARVLQEEVLAGFERTLPADHPNLRRARINLANTLKEWGDTAAARALQEAVLEACERTLPEDHPELLAARLNLANTLWWAGDLAGARALQEAVLAAQERTLPEDHPQLHRTRNNLAITLWREGDGAGALALHEAVLAAFERTRSADHYEVIGARHNLASTLQDMGDLAGARALQEAVLAAYERTLLADHPILLNARANLAFTLFAQGELAAARALAPDQVAGMRTRVLSSLSSAPREAGEVVRSELARLAELLFLSRSVDSALQAPVFELQETMRVVALEAARALRSATDPEIEAVMDEARSVRAALNDLVSGSSEEQDAGELSAELTRLMQQRDRLERQASLHLAESGVVTRPVEIGPLSAALGSDGAAVAYRRVAHAFFDVEAGEVGADILLAHVLLPGGALTRIDLGPASELEELVLAWRKATGAPLRHRGVRAPVSGNAPPEVPSGTKLRERLLDPVLDTIGDDTRRLFVCADDVVFLVPLDGLPYEDGRVGDRWTIANEVSFARLMVPSDPLETAPGLFALGGVDYDLGAGAPEPTGAVAASSRAAMPDRFTHLLETGSEVETAGALFEDLLETGPVVVTEKDATKAALFSQAPGKRYLHLATHGWFASEAMRSTADEVRGGEPEGFARMDVQERVTGMAPMLLCGLALAGANNGRDSLGRMNGILTAEELCSLDLSACDLAVLSACETNVGIRRAGQGIQSLQAALYAAGARSSITSLWKVDDAATRRLMELFYTNLWEAKMPKHRALWEAKRALRDDGAPVRDWAGWVLTGDPD